MEIYDFQDDRRLDSGRVGINSAPTVSVNQLIFYNHVIINAPLNALQDHCGPIPTPGYLQPDLLQNNCRWRIPPFR